MKTALLRVVVALGVVLLLLIPARVSYAQFLSPGPLAKAHASVEGDQHCNDCHSSGKRVDQAACLKCHSDLGARINAGQGLHGLQYKGKACEGCHVDHLGPSASITKWPGGDSSRLEHALTGWPLDGAHKTTACNKCHNKPNARGNPTFLGASSNCTSCHKDPHEGRFGSTCTSCHNEAIWRDLKLDTFNHDQARYPLKGAHQTVACVKCHSDLPPKYVGLKFGACTDCHKDPHVGRLGAACIDCHDEAKWKPVNFQHKGARHPGLSLGGGHASVLCVTCHDRGNLVSPSKGTACVGCHRPVHEAPFGRACANCHSSIQWLGLPRTVGLSSHGLTSYPLTGKHEEVNCAGCHKAELSRDARYRKLAFARCVDCHQDKHGGEFAASEGGECKKCHTTTGYRPTLFASEAHASTRFPLLGKHVASPCSSCHTASRPRLDLRVARQACLDCHANPHGNQFAKEMAQGGCAHCHEATGWNLPKIDHSSWPLTGAHATAQCDSCHHPTPEDRKSGRGGSYRGVPRNCGGCHDDAHLGQFRLKQPVFECDKCHSTQTYKIPSFDHQAMTGWGLTGAHAKVECAKCHGTANVSGERPTTRWRLASRECNFCHANPHEPKSTAAVPASRGSTAMLLASVADVTPTPGAIPSSAPSTAAPIRSPAPATPPPRGASPRKSFTEVVPCSACHSTAWKARDATATGDVKFDHSTTGFPLTGQHIHAPCTSCHNGQPLKRACVSCHEDFHRGRLQQSCDNCHIPAGWKETRPLEIHRMTRFPLTGMHVLADCTQCHLRASERKFSDAPIACYGCHEQDYRRPGIFPVHVGSASSAPLPRDCSLCHRAVAWVPANVPTSLAGSVGAAVQGQVAPPGHDLRFPIAFGIHRTATCDDCHTTLASPRAVRCVGCHAHDPVLLMQQHKRPMATDGASCLTCHPGGVRR
jgi:hypothetical protein